MKYFNFLGIILIVERNIYGGTIIHVTNKGLQISKTIKGAVTVFCGKYEISELKWNNTSNNDRHQRNNQELRLAAGA